MLTRFRIFTIYWLPLIAYCLLIYIQSDHPSPEKLPSFAFMDKLLHFMAYGVLGILFYRAYETLKCMHRHQLVMLFSLVSATLYGISDEVHQYFVPYRYADFFDVIADLLGAACGTYLYHLWFHRKQSAG